MTGRVYPRESSSQMVPTDDLARDRANEALCRFVFPNHFVPRAEMVDAVIVALAGEGDWRADLPQRRVVAS